MPEIGYFLSSEEHGAPSLVRIAQQAENAGFESVWISDHFHPWLDEQVRARSWVHHRRIAATTSLRVTTAVTCPTFAFIQRSSPRPQPRPRRCSTAGSASASEWREPQRAHPRSALAAGRHSARDARRSGRVMRALWTGEVTSHHGRHYTVENASPLLAAGRTVPVLVSGFGPKATDSRGAHRRRLRGIRSRTRNSCSAYAGGAVAVRRPPCEDLLGSRQGPMREARRTSSGDRAGPRRAHSRAPDAGALRARRRSWSPRRTRHQSVTCGPDPRLHAQAIKRVRRRGIMTRST